MGMNQTHDCDTRQVSTDPPPPDPGYPYQAQPMYPGQYPPRRPSQWRSGESWLWSGLVAVMCAAVFGSVYWTQSYSDLDIGSISLPLYLLACVPVVVLRATRTAPYLMASLALPTGLVVAVMGRIAVDVINDPTSHNLWPFEIVIAGIVGLFWGFLAGGVGELVLRARDGRKR
jgi:hypothetical protein